MKKHQTSLRSAFLFLSILFAISLISLAAADHFRAAAISNLSNFPLHSSLANAAAPMMQAGPNCMGFGFTYGRGFAPDPATEARPISVVSGDFDKDGKTDLVASNLFGNSISVLLGDGAGGFGIATNIPVVGDGKGAPSGLAVGDFDGDTNLDLAIAIEYNPGRVFVMSGNGAGSFAVTGMLDAGVVTTAVAVSDFNGDSKPDIAAVNKGDALMALAGSVSVFLNNGTGGFGAPTTLTPGTTPVALAVGEFTGDTQADIAVVNSDSNNVSLFANTGSGTFGAATILAVGTNPNGIVAGFFNNDTRLDLAVANTGSDNVSILFANGSGGFGAATNFAGGVTPFGLITNDFNGDGKADLGISNGFANQASVLLNNGAGGFGAPQTTAVGSQPLSLASGDFNTDAKADLAVANSASNNITILLGKGNGTFGGTTFLFSNPQAVVLEDFNQDTRTDLAVANFGGDKVTVFLADNSGGYSMPNEFDVGIKPISMTSGDFNGDSNVDLAIANNGSANVSILLGNGAGSFAAAAHFITGSQPSSIASGDFDGDTKLDLVTANDAGNNVSLLLGQGDGTFATTGAFAAGTRPTSIDVDDFNGDTKLDLAVANLDSTFVSILIGNGAGSFAAGANVNLPGGGKGRSVTTNDLNKDGKTDLVVTLDASTQLAIALGNGNGTFAAPTSIDAGGTNPSEVIVNDFDGDAKADLAVTLSGNDFISLLRGNGDGTFAAAKTFPTGVGPVSLADGDLNNDKRVDLAVVSSTANSMTLLLNTCANTPPSITPATMVTQTQGSIMRTMIANISDLETAADSLTVTVSAPMNVLVSNITNTNGTVAANIEMGCPVPIGNQLVFLQVVDSNGLATQTPLTINVTANTPPVVGNFTNVEVVNGESRVFVPQPFATDNGQVTEITVVSNTPGFKGTFGGHPRGGFLVTDAGPVGTYDLTVTFVDNCGLTVTRPAQLNVVPRLSIISLDPATKQAQSGEFTLMVNGSGFTPNSKVSWITLVNQAERATTFISSTKLSATILASDINLNAAGSVFISVSDPVAGGIISNLMQFNITAPNPVPAITTLNPASAIAGAPGFPLTINGSNFLNNSVVKFNGADRTTTFVSATQLTIAVTGAELANPGSATISVFNPTPGGGTSNAVSLPINNPAPGAITLNPTSAIVGSAATLLNVNGTGFRPDSVIRVNGADRTTTVVSATLLTTSLSPADLAAAGTLKIAVNTPPPGGGLSPETNFTVNNPAPVLTILEPSTVLAGSAAFVLKIHGGGFIAGSQVKFNGADRATTLVSAAQLTIAVTAAEVANTGSITIAVANPTPGGGTSNQLTLPINNPAPTLTTLAPNATLVGSAATLVTLTGSGFRPNSVVKVNGADRATTFDSATQLKTTLSVGDLASATILKLSVFTPTPGGGTTAELNFTVGNPLPTLTSLNPATAIAGGAAFTLAVNGTGFVAGTVVKFNNVDRAGTIVNGTQLTIAIAAGDIANAGSAKLSVVNAAPAGGTSNELTLPINNPAPIPTSVDKPAITAGAGATMLTITGSGFRPNSIGRVNGSDRVTTFVSATELKVMLLGSDVASGSTLKLTVFTPTPGGGTSPELTVTVNNPSPTVTSLSPNAAFKGDPAFMLTVTGTNFVPTSVVRWNGADRATTFVSATQLKASIPDTDLAADGLFDVTVFNPTPGGGTSSAAKFAVNPLTGFEADLSPRPKGDNKVSIADWVLVGRMASGLDSTQDSSEFQRADCAPLSTFGDGKITIADWVQAGRFAVGLDPITPAQGPSRPANSLQAEELRTQAAAFAEAQPELTRVVRARSVEFTRGELNALPIELEAQGNENGVSFSLNFDAKQLLFSHAVAPEGWSVNVNAEQSGRLGLMVAMSAGRVAQLGKQPVVTAYFASLGGTNVATTEISFDDQVFTREIADVKAALLPKAAYEKATITIKGRGIANVRAANYAGPDVAGDSIASAFGVDLATEAAGAVSAPLPERLAGTTVNITDSKGVTKAAPLFFVSPTQVNYLLPAGLAEGLANVTITNRNGVASRGSVLVNAIAPSVFSADATGKGLAAADVVRVRSDGKQLWERTYRFDPSANQVVATPIDLGPERGKDSDKVFLILYGTGLRGRADLRQVKVKLGDVYVQAEYAGTQGGYAGLDQINVLIPRQLIGRGAINAELIVNGQAANVVKVQIR